MATGAYTVYDNSWHEEHDRLALLEAWLDPWTTSQLDALGITTGWSCLEAGAGGGSIAEWLCTRVGVEGHVLATDIDTRFVGALRHPSLEVQQHDISADELPTGRFDLVHARLLLSHLSSPDVVLTSLIDAVKPGGWLLVEDFAHFTLGFVDPGQDSDSSRFWQAALTLCLQFMQTRGIELELGGRLYRMCRNGGLSDVHAEGRVTMERGGSIYAAGLMHSFRRLSALGAMASLGQDKLDRTLAHHGGRQRRFVAQRRQRLDQS